MKKKIIILVLALSSIVLKAQEEYNFINEVIHYNDKYDEKIYISNSFLSIKDTPLCLEKFNNETLEFWWKMNPKAPPIELFLSNFNIDYLAFKFRELCVDSSLKTELLGNKFYVVDEKYKKENPKKTYLTISRPIFNCTQKWAIILKSNYRPYTQTGGNVMMHIYVEIEGKWVLYYSFNIGLT